MMNALEVGKEYAKALVELAEENKVLQKIEEDMLHFGQLLEAEPSFRIFLESPNISSQEKKSFLDKVLKKHVSSLFLHFLFLIGDRDRFLLFPYIQKSFKDFMDQKMGRMGVQVLTARELSPETQGKIRNVLEEKIKKKIRLHHRVQPEILGGLVMKIGDLQIDFSLRSQLERLKKKFLEKKYQLK